MSCVKCTRFRISKILCRSDNTTKRVSHIVHRSSQVRLAGQGTFYGEVFLMTASVIISTGSEESFNSRQETALRDLRMVISHLCLLSKIFFIEHPLSHPHKEFR